MASETWSAILSGWPSVTDSEVNKKRSLNLEKLLPTCTNRPGHTAGPGRMVYPFYGNCGGMVGAKVRSGRRSLGGQRGDSGGGMRGTGRRVSRSRAGEGSTFAN